MSTQTGKVGQLLFLMHPGDVQFSGYGLTVQPGTINQLVGLLMVDRPRPVSRTWLAKVERTYGTYELQRMAKTGERGIACQMWIADDSIPYVRPLVGTMTYAIQEALYPLLLRLPNPQFVVSWDSHNRLWRSEFHHATEREEAQKNIPPMPQPRFEMGQVVATPAALGALEEAGQLPHEFLYRHLAGDWGEVDEHDRKANEHALKHGERLLSAYTTKRGIRIWIITEHDRSVTTLLLPSDY